MPLVVSHPRAGNRAGSGEKRGAGMPLDVSHPRAGNRAGSGKEGGARMPLDPHQARRCLRRNHGGYEY